jgi:iron complex transport system substrate-binding protein
VKRLALHISISCLVLAGSLLAACGSTPSPAIPDASPTQQHERDGLSLIDALGRTVEFDLAPRRIVVAGKSSLTIVDTLFLFPEARDRVVGIVAGRQNPGAFLGLVDPTFDQKATLEVEAGPEQILPLKPDVVVLRSFMAESLGKALTEVEVPVVYVDLETPEQYFRDVATLGQLLGNPARAVEITAYYQSSLDYVNDQLDGLAPDDRPTVLLVQHSDRGGEVALNVPSASWIQTTEATLAGGRPVWEEAATGGGWTVVSFEQIAAWDPDKIFVIDYSGDSAKTVDQLRADPQWQALRATQEGEIFGFAADIFSWDQPDPRWILGVTWLAGKIYPGRFASLDMEQEVIRFFEQMYGMDRASIEASILPKLKGNVQ